MYLNFPKNVTGNYSEIGFLKPDDNTIKINDGVMSVYCPTPTVPPAPVPDPEASQDQQVNSYKLNFINPDLYQDNQYFVSDLKKPITPAAWQSADLKNNYPQYQYFSGYYDAATSQFQPVGTPEHMPPLVLLFETGNINSVKLDEPTNFEYQIPLVDDEGVESNYKLKISYSIENENNDIYVSCSIDIYDGDEYVEGYTARNNDLYIYQTTLLKEESLNYFICGADTVKTVAGDDQTADGTIRSNMLVMDLIHAENTEGNAYYCQHMGLCLDLNYLKDTYGVQLNSAYLTKEEIPEFWVDSYHQNVYHGDDSNIPYIVPAAVDSPFYRSTGVNSQTETNFGLLTDDIGINTKRFYLYEYNRTVRPFEYIIPLYDSNEDLSEYYIDIFQERIVGNQDNIHLGIFINFYQGNTYIDGTYQEVSFSNQERAPQIGPYAYIGADTYATKDYNEEEPISITNNLLTAGVFYITYNGAGNSIYVSGPTVGVDLSWLETEYGLHLGSDWLTIPEE